MIPNKSVIFGQKYKYSGLEEKDFPKEVVSNSGKKSSNGAPKDKY